MGYSDVSSHEFTQDSSSLKPQRRSELPAHGPSSCASNSDARGCFPRDLPSYYHLNSSTDVLSPEPSSRWTERGAIFFGWRYALGSWLNLLLLLMPASWATSTLMKISHGITFALCVVALIPLVRLHDISTWELANRIGGSKTGLLNGSMSNFVEIVIAISALRKCELRVVQSMLVGSMLSKILLVLGLCFFAGGLKFSEQGFDPTATQIHSSLLSLSVGAVLLPAAYHFMLGDATSLETQKINILKMSHAVSIILLFIYLSYLLFQLWSHTHLYKDQHDKKSSRLSASIRENRLRDKAESRGRIPLQRFNTQPAPDYRRPLIQGSYPDLRRSFVLSPRAGSETSFDVETTLNSPFANGQSVAFRPEGGGIPMSRESTYSGDVSSPTTLIPESHPVYLDIDVESRPEPKMSWFLTLSLLVLVTAALAVTVELLVTAMDEISTTISKEWVGLILLPAISSVAECITAVRVSVKDELTLSVSVAVGSTIQVALFVIPLTVILGWITNKPLSLLMDPFQSMVLYIAVNTMSYVVADGKSNWLEGVILICLYIIVAVSFWFYPGSDLSNTLAACTVTKS